MLNPILLLVAASNVAQAEEKRLGADTVGLVQTWLTVLDQDTDEVAEPAGYGDPEDDPGVKVRRARFGLEGKEGSVKYGLLVGVSTPYDSLGGDADETVGLVDAYGGWQPLADAGPLAELWLVAGIQKVPVSREMLMSAGELALGDRSVATEWLAPGRDAGLMLDASMGGEDSLAVRLRVGGFNGNGSALGDDDAGKMVAARAEIVQGPGDTYETWGSVDGFTIGVAGDFWMDSSLSTDTTGFGGDVLTRVGGLALLIEAHMVNLVPTNSDIDLPGVMAATSRLGGVAQLGYTIGNLEPVARFSMFDDHTELEDNGDVGEAMAGLTWHAMEDTIRVGGGWITRLELAGAPASNDTARLWLQLKL